MDLDELQTLRNRLAGELEHAEAELSPLPRLSAHDRAQRKRIIDELDAAIARLQKNRMGA